MNQTQPANFIDVQRRRAGAVKMASGASVG
jgi:hypothetical protein